MSCSGRGRRKRWSLAAELSVMRTPVESTGVRGPDEMTPADPGRRTRSFLFFRRTGQMWKWNSWLGVLYAGGVLMVVGKWRVETDVGILMLMGGSLLGLAAMAWSALSIRCPQCGARPWWMAMNGKCKGLAGLSRCPSCGFEPPATADERG
jgi:predicted RNA-binding Zn-ribbon protein involved in translation (DUF1610 family)